MSGITQKLKESFVEGLGLRPETEVENLTYRSIPEWDSLGHMQLISQIEIDFDVMLETQEVIDMSSFTKAIEILNGHGVQLEA
jgi:acyl carrier protein